MSWTFLSPNTYASHPEQLALSHFSLDTNTYKYPSQTFLFWDTSKMTKVVFSFIALGLLNTDLANHHNFW